MLGVWYFLAHLLSPHFVKCPSPLASSPLHHFCPGTLAGCFCFLGVHPIQGAGAIEISMITFENLMPT
jgi:hypothetical protein